MTKMLKKASKPLTYGTVVFAVIFLVLAIYFMTNLTDIRVEYVIEIDATTGERLKVISPSLYQNLALPRINGVYNPLLTTLFNMYQAIQSVNFAVYYFSIAIAVSFGVLVFFANHSRRKYYISNVIFGIAVPVFLIIFAFVIFGKIASINSTYLSDADFVYAVEKAQLATRIKGDYLALNRLGEEAIRAAVVPVDYSILTITQVLLVLFIVYQIIYAVYCVIFFLASNRKAGI